MGARDLVAEVEILDWKVRFGRIEPHVALASIQQIRIALSLSLDPKAHRLVGPAICRVLDILMETEK
jgi:hypothetical protein